MAGCHLYVFEGIAHIHLRKLNKPTNKNGMIKKWIYSIGNVVFLGLCKLMQSKCTKNQDWTFWNAGCIVPRLFQTIAWGWWFHFFISKEYIIKSVCRETHAFCWCLLTSIYISWFIYQQLISIGLSGMSDTEGHSWFCIDTKNTYNKLAAGKRSREWKTFKGSHQVLTFSKVYAADVEVMTHRTPDVSMYFMFSLFIWFSWVRQSLTTNDTTS